MLVFTLVVQPQQYKQQNNKIYQTTSNGRVLTEKGYYDLKTNNFVDGKGRKNPAPKWTIQKGGLK
jgi:hypothetical protein